MADDNDAVEQAAKILTDLQEELTGEAEAMFQEWFQNFGVDDKLVACRKCGAVIVLDLAGTHHSYHLAQVSALLLLQSDRTAITDPMHLRAINQQLHALGVVFFDGKLIPVSAIERKG